MMITDAVHSTEDPCPGNDFNMRDDRCHGRVLVFAPGYPSEADPVSYVFHRTACEAMRRAGAELRVLAPVAWTPFLLTKLSERWNRSARMPRREVVAGVAIERPRYFQIPRGDILGWPHPQFARLLRRALSPSDALIHAHFAYPCGLAAVRVAVQRRIPCVVTLHGSDVNRYPNISRRCGRRFLETARGADALLAVSEALAAKTQELCGRRPIVIPIGIDLAKFSAREDTASARRALGLPLDAFIVLYIGFLYRAKGVLELVAATDALRADGVVCVFVGDGPLRGEVAGKPGCLWQGFQPNETVVRYLAAADVAVLPSYSEGMPTALVEAGAMGTPVIASRVGGIPELLGDDRGLLIEPGSVAAIVDAIQTARRHPLDMRRRSQRLHRYVAEHYDAVQNARRQLEIYRSVIERFRKVP